MDYFVVFWPQLLNLKPQQLIQSLKTRILAQFPIKTFKE